MKVKLTNFVGLVLICALALGFTHQFISSTLADGGCDQSGSPDETVTCKDTSDGDITTGGGNDSVSVDNSDVGNIDTGEGNDLIESTGPNSGNDGVFTGPDGEGLSTIQSIDAGEGNNTIDVQNTIVGNDLFYGNDTLSEGSIVFGDGNNSLTVDHSAVEGIVGGDGNNTVIIENGAVTGIATLGDGNNQVDVKTNALLYIVGTGEGNDTVAVDQSSGVLMVVTGGGDDNLSLNNFTYLADAGSGNDTVTVNQSMSTYFVPVTALDGGDDYDVLNFKFTVGSQKEKDTFNSLVSGDSSCGTLYFGGHFYFWENFEELNFLLKVAAASGSSDVVVSVLGDSRLNNRDMAAPIAIYCKSGQIEGWVIDPATGSGNQQFVAPLSAFPASSNGVDGSLSGDQATISYAGYSFIFPTSICPG